jgi:hypothetical protein
MAPVKILVVDHNVVVRLSLTRKTHTPWRPSSFRRITTRRCVSLQNSAAYRVSSPWRDQLWRLAFELPRYSTGDRIANQRFNSGRQSPLLSELCDGLKEQRGASVSGRSYGVLGDLTHGGTRALGAPFADGAKQERFKAATIALVGVALAARAMRSHKVLTATISWRLSRRSSLRSIKESRLIPPWREVQQAHLEEVRHMRIGMPRPSLRKSIAARKELGPSTPCSWNYACK